jgi:hypothetical protein
VSQLSAIDARWLGGAGRLAFAISNAGTLATICFIARSVSTKDAFAF